MGRPQQGSGSSVLAMSRRRHHHHCCCCCVRGCVMWSAAVNLFEVVALVTVALFLLVGVVVTALRPAPLFGLLFGRLRPSARLSALATRVALWAEVCATRRHITAATPPALSLGLGLGLL